MKQKLKIKLNLKNFFSKILKNFAGIVQLVEHLLAKEDVARSSRVTRFLNPYLYFFTYFFSLSTDFLQNSQSKLCFSS